MPCGSGLVALGNRCSKQAPNSCNAGQDSTRC
jgi:hypothetical protein